MTSNTKQNGKVGLMEIQKGYHVTHPDLAGCYKVLFRKRNKRVRIKLIGGEELETVLKDELEVVRIKGYIGSEPANVYDYVSHIGDVGEEMYRVTELLAGETPEIFNVRIEHVTTGEQQVVTPDKLGNVSDKAIRANKYFRDKNGDIVLDWREVDSGVVSLISMNYMGSWWWGSEGVKYPFNRHETQKSSASFWRHIRSEMPPSLPIPQQSLKDELEELVRHNADFRVEDDSFDYEYGSIIATQKSYCTYVDFDDHDIYVDAVVLFPPDIEDDTQVLHFTDCEDIEFLVEIDTTGLMVDEIDICGFTFFHVQGSITCEEST